jgi:hypothetical protein
MVPYAVHLFAFFVYSPTTLSNHVGEILANKTQADMQGSGVVASV